MRLKYYLRGIGLGIIFATIVITVSAGLNNNRLSDDEIIEEALKLGMIMPETETQLDTEEDTGQIEDTQNSNSGNNENSTENVSNSQGQETDNSNNVQDTTQPQNSEGQETANSNDGQNQPNNNDLTDNPNQIQNGEQTSPQDTQVQVQAPAPEEIVYVEYYVRVGATAHEVAMGLERVGAVENGLDFRNYLSQKGYTHKLRVGNYQIPVGGDYEEIARILMKRN